MSSSMFLVTQPGAVAQLPALTVDVVTPSFASTALALFCGLMTGTLAFGVSFLTIFQHLVHYNRPNRQKFIVRILMLVPIYSVLSICVLIAPTLFVYFEGMRDAWEAAVIYFFCQLILVYCGGESSCAHMIQQHPGSIKHKFPFNLCLKNEIPLNPEFVKNSKKAMIQFVVLKPVMGIAAIIVFHCGHYYSWWWRTFELLTYNISYTLALYALVLFYVATRYHPGLKGSNPVRKFLAVKIIVFATFWQSCFVYFLPGLNHQQSRAWVNFILLCEMPIFSLLQAWAFPVWEFSHVPVRDDVVLDSMESPDEFNMTSKEIKSMDSHSTAPWGSYAVNVSDTIPPGIQSPALTQSTVNHSEPPTTVNLDTPETADSSSVTANQDAAESSYVRAAAVGIGTSIAKVPKKLIPRQLKNQIASVADPDQRRKAFDNVMEAVNMNDILTDINYQFHPKYRDHVLMETAENPEPMDEDDDAMSPNQQVVADFDPQESPDVTEDTQGLSNDDESFTVKKAGKARVKRAPENYYFKTHLPGFTDHPMTSDTSKTPAFRQRRHSENRKTPATATDNSSETGSRSLQDERTLRRLNSTVGSNSRSASSDGICTKSKKHPIDWWADGTGGWGAVDSGSRVQALPPPSTHSRAPESSMGSTTAGSRRAQVAPSWRHSSPKPSSIPPPPSVRPYSSLSSVTPARPRPTTEAMSSQQDFGEGVEKPCMSPMGVTELKRVIGRPDLRHSSIERRFDRSSSRFETSDGEGSNDSVDQFTWQKAVTSSQDNLGAANC
eukprot:Selendium_serpulae@DN6016_c1_g1_i3.p1